MKKILGMIFMFSASFIFAGELKISVIDKELDFPLEGTKLTLESNSKIKTVADEDGNAVLNLPDFVSSGKVKASLPGYREITVDFSGTEKILVINMSISDVIEGEELVVNRNAPEKTEEKVGVSTVMTKEQMHTTANIGIAEDCMSSVRTLPGISFSGAWGSEPSVRGGEPRETACLLDGMYTIFPWHWGGGVSIFNPSIVDSIKLSNGVFPAKYGRASAGIMEATTLTPDYEKWHLNACISTTCADAFVQIPFGKNLGGMIAGTHLSYLDPIVWTYQKLGNDDLDMLERAPYIRDAFIKANFTPNPELFISLVGFFGSDGLGIDQTEEEDGLKTRAIMDYDIYQALGGINVKYLPSDKLMLHGLLSYNWMSEDMDMSIKESGTIRYNDEFVNKYSSVYPSVQKGGSYSFPVLESSNQEIITSHLFTGRFESEIELNARNHLCAGIEEVFLFGNSEEKVDGWGDIEINGNNLFRRAKFSTTADGNFILDNAAFLSWNYGADNDLIQSEIGIRGEFITLWNPTECYSVNFVPDICPRASVTVTPWRQIGKIDKVSFSAGSGLFVSIPRETMILTDEMGMSKYGEHPNRAIFAVLGSNLALTDGWNFKLESYYKYYLSRIYAYSYTTAISDYQDAKFCAGSDGNGHVFGIDTMIEKQAGKKWDGYISYSFTYARMNNPANLKSDVHAESTIYGEPLDEWYYPSYHRFHTLNLVSNLHFGKGWTFTVKGTLASGAPLDDVGNITCYAARMEDGTIIQRYTRSSVYSDSLRTDLSCPVDLRISKTWKTKNDKAECEWYFALQDVFVNLYSPKTYKSYNEYTGKKSDVSQSADFSIGMPIPSLGFKVKF
jgi:hypothetical protein